MLRYDASMRQADSLRGLSVGDAFGEGFFVPDAAEAVRQRRLPPPPWRWTDDTMMARGLCEVLDACGAVDPDQLAAVFARNYALDPQRGYGGTAHDILQGIGAGRPWKRVSGEVFGGKGSMGNGAAMRVAPLGARFADDLARVRVEAAQSALPTHQHPEGVAGAVAVAVATALACGGAGPDALWEAVLDLTPDGPTREGLVAARELGAVPVELAADRLGSGRLVTAPDTVPFAIWCAAGCLDDFEEALWRTVAGLGDRDTTCAMVGGIVGARVGIEGIPAAWRDWTEPV
jgi:ADP-ribosylglycohydrolase